MALDHKPNTLDFSCIDLYMAAQVNSGFRCFTPRDQEASDGKGQV